MGLRAQVYKVLLNVASGKHLTSDSVAVISLKGGDGELRLYLSVHLYIVCETFLAEEFQENKFLFTYLNQAFTFATLLSVARV